MAATDLRKPLTRGQLRVKTEVCDNLVVLIGCHNFDYLRGATEGVGAEENFFGGKEKKCKVKKIYLEKKL